MRVEVVERCLRGLINDELHYAMGPEHRFVADGKDVLLMNKYGGYTRIRGDEMPHLVELLQELITTLAARSDQETARRPDHHA